MNTKREPEKTLLDKYLEDPEFGRLLAQEELYPGSDRGSLRASW